MAHSLSAKKRIRQTEKRRSRNRARKEVLKNETKAFTAAITKGDAPTAETALKALVSTLDRVKNKSAIHKNTAARRRSRLTKRLNALKAGPAKSGKAA
ncbi:MAG: 30S ribosomal protein S20 [Burkholderiales bacterium]|nr:30S ribosomal protein S20 [Phycisphaerae bacterium]